MPDFLPVGSVRLRLGAVENVVIRTENTAYIAVSGVFGIVGTSGFEPLTSCLSSRRSKPTELCSLRRHMKKPSYSGMVSMLWELRDSNPRPSACKADALNQLS